MRLVTARFATCVKRNIEQTMVMNQVLTFGKDGAFVRYVNVDGFPQEKKGKVWDVTTQKGMIELVDDFFEHNFRDISKRKTIEWGQVTRDGAGNSSIGCRYQATIWGKDKKVMDQVFTFDSTASSCRSGMRGAEAR